MFSWKNGLLPASFSSYYIVYYMKGIPTILGNPSKDNIYLPNINSDQFGKRSIQFIGATFWNEIPYAIKEGNNLSIFCKKVKQYIIASYVANEL